MCSHFAVRPVRQSSLSHLQENQRAFECHLFLCLHVHIDWFNQRGRPLRSRNDLFEGGCCVRHRQHRAPQSSSPRNHNQFRVIEPLTRTNINIIEIQWTKRINVVFNLGQSNTSPHSFYAGETSAEQSGLFLVALEGRDSGDTSVKNALLRDTVTRLDSVLSLGRRSTSSGILRFWSRMLLTRTLAQNYFCQVWDNNVTLTQSLPNANHTQLTNNRERYECIHPRKFAALHRTGETVQGQQKDFCVVLPNTVVATRNSVKIYFATSAGHQNSNNHVTAWKKLVSSCSSRIHNATFSHSGHIRCDRKVIELLLHAPFCPVLCVRNLKIHVLLSLSFDLHTLVSQSVKQDKSWSRKNRPCEESTTNLWVGRRIQRHNLKEQPRSTVQNRDSGMDQCTIRLIAVWFQPWTGDRAEEAGVCLEWVKVLLPRASTTVHLSNPGCLLTETKLQWRALIFLCIGLSCSALPFTGSQHFPSTPTTHFPPPCFLSQSHPPSSHSLIKTKMSECARLTFWSQLFAYSTPQPPGSKLHLWRQFINSCESSLSSFSPIEIRGSHNQFGKSFQEILLEKCPGNKNGGWTLWLAWLYEYGASQTIRTCRFYVLENRQQQRRSHFSIGGSFLSVFSRADFLCSMQLLLDKLERPTACLYQVKKAVRHQMKLKLQQKAQLCLASGANSW